MAIKNIYDTEISAVSFTWNGNTIATQAWVNANVSTPTLDAVTTAGGTTSNDITVGNITASSSLLGGSYTQPGGSSWTTSNSQLILGGAHNAGFNTGTKAKLLISGYDNDGSTIYPIFVEDENGYADFWVKNRPSAAGKSTAFFSGNVGIGTTSPSYVLEVNGDTAAAVLSVKNAANSRDTFRSENAAGTRTFNVGNDASGHGIALIRNSSGTTTSYLAGSGNSYINGGNVGIGTTVPAHKLDVVSNQVIARFKSTDSSTSGFSEVYYENDAGVRLIVGSIGSGYTNSAWAGARYMYATAGDLMIKTLGSGTNLRFYTAGATNERMRIDGSGNVGIGTTSPTTPLNVFSSTATNIAKFENNTNNIVVNIGDSSNNSYANLVLQSDAGTAQFFKAGTAYTSWGGARSLNIYNSSGEIAFHPNGTANAMFINNSGNVGIGTTSPGAKLHVFDVSTDILTESTTGAARNILKSSTGEWRLGTNAGQSNNFWIYQPALAQYVFNINTSGNVGIGTTSPSHKLDVSGGNIKTDKALISQGANSNWTGAATFMDWQSGVGYGRVGVYDYAASIWRPLNINDGSIYITGSNGNVGIGTTSPSQKLHVSGSSAAVANLYSTGFTNLDLVSTRTSGNLGGIRFKQNADTYISVEVNGVIDGGLEIKTGNGDVAPTARVKVDASGNVGIGTTSPAYKLDVNGSMHSTNITIADAIYHEGDTNTVVGFGTDTINLSTGGGVRATINNSGAKFNNDVVVVGGATLSLGERGEPDDLGRTVLLEGAANAGSGEGAGRIFFSEHNSTTAGADSYGLSLYYEGDPNIALPSGFQPNTGNGTWSLRRHNNSVNGDAIMSGSRTNSDVQFGGSITIGSGVTLSESTDRADLLSVTSSTSGWGGLQITNTAGEGIWSFMVDGAAAGIYDDQNGDWAVYCVENSYVQLRHNGTGKLTTSSSGVDVAGRIYLSANNSHIEFNTSASSGHPKIQMGADADFSFVNTAGSTNLHIENGGNIGIGTTSPAASLHIEKPGDQASSVKGIVLSSGAAGTNKFLPSITWSYGASGTPDFARIEAQRGGGVSSRILFSTANSSGTMSEAVRINEDGNVGIGTTSPSEKLQVGSGSADDRIRVYYSDGAYSEQTGWGMEFARNASYLRPNNNNARTLNIGNSGLAWSGVNVESTNFTWNSNAVATQSWVTSQGYGAVYTPDVYEWAGGLFNASGAPIDIAGPMVNGTTTTSQVSPSEIQFTAAGTYMISWSLNWESLYANRSVFGAGAYLNGFIIPGSSNLQYFRYNTYGHASTTNATFSVQVAANDVISWRTLLHSGAVNHATTPIGGDMGVITIHRIA